MIHWDKNKERNEAVSDFPQCMIMSKWNTMETHSHGYWHFDIEIRNN